MRGLVQDPQLVLTALAKGLADRAVAGLCVYWCSRERTGIYAPKIDSLIIIQIAIMQETCLLLLIVTQAQYL